MGDGTSAGVGSASQRSAGLQSVWCFCQCVEAVTDVEILRLLESDVPVVRVLLSSSALASAAYSPDGTLASTSRTALPTAIPASRYWSSWGS